MIPGADILDMAFSIISKQTVTYYRAIDRTLNAIGQNITEYASPTLITGSLQPVPKRLYQVYGLDLQRAYFTFYSSNNISDIQRDISADQISFQGYRYQCESNVNWYGIDGWDETLCVLIGREPTSLFGFNEYPSVNNYLNFENGNFPVVENS